MLFVTPDHAAVRELFYASTVCGGFSSQRILIIAPKSCTGHEPQGAEMRVLRPDRGRPCKLVDVNSGESTI